MSRIDYRDERLGAALRELDIPEHRPGFHAELHRRLAEERLASVAVRRDRRTRRRAQLRWGLRAAAVAAVAAILLVAIGIPQTERTPPIVGPGLASAAEIKEKVRRALAALENATGVVVSDGPRKGDVQRWRFALTDEGDFRLIGLSGREKVAYDASRGVAWRVGTSASVGGDALFYSVRRGVAPGPPDEGPPTWVIPDAFGAFVRALLAAEDARVREIAYQGRPAWRLEVDAVPNAIVPEFSGDRFEITVDRATGIPVRVVETKEGSFLGEIRIRNLAVNVDLARDTFRFRFPPGADVMRSDVGFRRVPLDAVEGIVGYPPLVPARIPSGYELAEVAIARESGPTGVEAGNPPSRMVVSLSYRRGLDQFVVTTRLADVPVEGEPKLSPQELWSDPLATGEGFVDERERVTIRDGVLAGEEAELVLVPRGIPHLWALTDDLVVTVGGDLSRSELLTVAESLARRKSP